MKVPSVADTVISYSPDGQPDNEYDTCSASLKFICSDMISSSFCLIDIVPSPKSSLNISCNNSVVVLYVADIGPFETEAYVAMYLILVHNLHLVCPLAQIQ